MNKRIMSRRFFTSLLVVTAVYIVWLLIFHYSTGQSGGSPAGKAAQDERMPYADLAAAYDQLQQQLQKADSTHIIRRYHNRYALFSAERVFDEKVMEMSRGYFQSQLGRERIYLDLPDFDWKRDDEARPVDALRLTFRGNGIPQNVEQLAKSGLMDPKLHAFYNALIQQNTVLWTRDDASLDFAIKTVQGGLYVAKSTPFIALQRLSKDDVAKMQSASLPFLWRAYVDEDQQRAIQQALLAEPQGPLDLVGPSQPGGTKRRVKPKVKPSAGPEMPKSQADVLASYGQLPTSPEPHGPFASAATKSVLDSLPDIAGAIEQQRPAISSLSLDERKVERLFEESMVEKSQSLIEALEWKKAINNKSLQEKFQPFSDAHLDRMAWLDPEFMTLFLINNLFNQYNVFSVFDKGVYLTMNALDTRMNVLYVSYNLRFDPLGPKDAKEGEVLPEGCGDKPVIISDEYFLIAAQPYSYLVRVYLPSCHLGASDYTQVDSFLSDMRILH